MESWLSFATGIIGLILGSTLMFYRQNKTAKVIANESALSAEWEKLYREQKTENESLRRTLHELQAKVFELEQKVNRLEIENQKLIEKTEEHEEIK